MSNEKPEFSVGDQVQLLSGGPTMTVQEILTSHLADSLPRYRCQWFAGKKLEGGVFEFGTLLVADCNQKKNVIPPVEKLAQLMLEGFDREDFLDQAEAADLIADAGGDSLLYTNDNGNIAIDKTVLSAFRKLTEGDAVWMKSARAWRRFDPDTDSIGDREQPL